MTPPLASSAPRAAVLRPGRWATAVATLLALGAPAAPADQAGGSFSEAVDVGLVLVPVVALRRGVPVPDLPERRFHLEVDGRPVPLASFDLGSGVPLRLVVLQDLSGSMANGGRLEASRAVLDALTDALDPVDAVAVATFAAGEAHVEVPFTTDRRAVLEAGAAWEPYGSTALHDAVARLPELAPLAGGARQAAILLTDGIDNASGVTPQRARELVRAAELPVYVLALLPVGVRPAAVPDADGQLALLRSLAHATGGRYASVTGGEEARRAAQEMVGELDRGYVLGFATAADGPERDHRIRVTVGGRVEAVRHRRRYTGRRPAAWSNP